MKSLFTRFVGVPVFCLFMALEAIAEENVGFFYDIPIRQKARLWWRMTIDRPTVSR